MKLTKKAQELLEICRQFDDVQITETKKGNIRVLVLF